ncbi:HEAT repeat domain-containing protein, partial [Streptomyces sp. CBMA123]|uniref:HEAT repeat domain-containing protein n=1 Tax=Streptomyces sp. CBMA123 TaxID=1896313 RepID=UPI001661CC7D
MDLADALAGLDAHPWATVSHAYGSAEDLPDLLRAFAEGGEEADEAREELYSSILHQGTVYPASVDAVPFLARIAAAGRQVVEVLWMLGGLAETDDEWEIPDGAVRAAVAGQLPLLTTLLADDEAEVRGLAASVVGRTRDTGTALPALRRRWTVEEDAAVRAELLIAIGRLDPAGAAAHARALLGDATPRPLRLAAVLVAVRAGEAWSGAHHTATLAVLPTAELTVDRSSMYHHELLPQVVEDLLARGTEADRENAFALIEAALRDDRPGVPFEALWAAGEACDRSRSAPARLVPAIAPHAGRDLAER